MAYTKQTFTSGQTLKASDLNTMSQGIKDLDDGKQAKLVSGTSLKTINGQSLLGSGNLTVEGGSGSTTYRPIAPEFMRFNLISHRGESIHYPENTIVAFQAALDNGLLIQEGDVRMTSDNIPVLLHDSSIDRTSNGSGAISSMTYATVSQYDFGSWKNSTFTGTKIPTLEEFLYWCKEHNCLAELDLAERYFTTEQKRIIYNIVLNTGMLSRTLFTATADELTDYISFDNKIIVSVSGIKSLSIAESKLPNYTNLPLVFPSIPVANMSKELVDYIHSLGMMAKVWCIDSESQLATAKSYGVDAVLTNVLVANTEDVKVDLSAYYTKDEVDALISPLSSQLIGLVERIESLESGAPLEKYNVTFVTNGYGVQPDALTEVVALPLILPVLTDESGYVFHGWYLDEDLTMPAVAGTRIYHDVTLYAKWSTHADYSKLTYQNGYAIHDGQGVIQASNTGPRVLMSDFLRVNKGDSIVLNSTDYEFIVYGYYDTNGTYTSNSFIDCNLNDTTSSSKNWGTSLTIGTPDAYGPQGTAHKITYPLYIRIVFRPTNNANVAFTADDIIPLMTYNITADNSHLTHLFE